jgi:hypothetical protein
LTNPRGSEDQRIAWDNEKVEDEVDYSMNAKISWQSSKIKGQIFIVGRQHKKDWFYIFLPRKQTIIFEVEEISPEPMNMWTIREARKLYIMTSTNELWTET